MTQIKLRRDTSANFTSKNPVLGVGEPAYETDTKKLKIGDGTTAYTQLEYFSAGGGGSTNISATLPLKIVDGVISLEVDGQTIQVVDGKLHANLDELGNEVNSLTGEVTDLSGRVTAAEADLANKASKLDLAAKQDKLSPIAPLGINQTTISNVTNGTFLTDTSVTLNSAFHINYTTDANARFLITAPGVGGATPTSFIQIPFTLGDLISFPFEKDNDSDIGLVFGYWKDNLFYPTMLYKAYTTYGSGSSSYAPFAFVSEAGKSSLEKIATYYGLSGAVSKSALVYHESIPLNATNYIQVTKNAGVPTVNMWFTISGASYPNRGYTQRMYTSDTTVLENLNKTNVCLFLSNDTSKAINLTKVTRRELGDTVLDPTPDALTTALNTYSNSFDATAKVITNDLSLAIGSGLAITDGKLTASSIAPSNMVTTDTAQTITGQKEFNHTILSLNQDLIRGQQSTSYRNGAGLSMGSNSTSTDGGAFAPQWRMYSTTGGVDRTETIMTTYNQSKLNASNFNTANKLVRLDSSGKLPAIDGSQLTNLPGGSSEPPANMVTTDTAQTITGVKKFTYSDHSFIVNQIDGTIGIAPDNNAVNSSDSAQFGTNDASTWFVGAKSKTGYIYANSLIRHNGSSNSPILDSSNLGSYVDGTTITYTNNKLTASSTAPDKETIMGYITPDYSTRTEVPWNTDNIAPTDGYVEVFGEGDGSTSAFVLEYTINGVKTAVSSCYATSRNTNFRLPVICPKGTVYSARGGALGHDLHFISMKGAV